MEKTAMKTFDSNLITPKSPTLLRDIDASFSSYLIPEKPNTCQPHHHHHNHHTLDDSTSELSIFDAHKYFNEVATNNNNIQKVTISSNSNNSRVSPVVVNVNTETERIVIPETTTRYSSASSSVDGYSSIRNYRTRSFHAATPTASSEASWNSQQGLLSHPPGAISVSMKNPQNPNPNHNLNNKLRKSLSKPIWLLRRKCPCTGKKSVQVNEKKSTELPKTKKIHSPLEETQPNRKNMETASPKDWVNLDQTQTRAAVKSQRFPSHSVVTTVRVPFTEGFTFPVLNPNPTSAGKHGVPNGVVLEDTPRESLEVFRPPDEVAVEAKHLGFSFPPEISRVVVDDGDAASDASSDLFEIESFSTGTQSTCPIVCRRSSRDSFDDGLATPAMTECYEPSEASIEWSVTTAEGYDESGGGGGGGGGGAAAEQWKRKGGSGLLVSCRCEKAVSVGPHPQPVKFGGGEGQRGATSAWRHVSGGGANSNSSGNSSGSISRVGGVNKPPLPRSHRNTPRVTSLAFAT